MDRNELKPTVQALEKTQSLCSEGKGSSELIADVATLFTCLRYDHNLFVYLTMH